MTNEKINELRAVVREELSAIRGEREAAHEDIPGQRLQGAWGELNAAGRVDVYDEEYARHERIQEGLPE